MSAIYAERFEAVFLCTHARGLHLSYSAAAKVLKKSKHFVEMWIEWYRDTKTVDDLPGNCSSATQLSECVKPKLS